MINVDNTIRGQGQIVGTITNQSVIRAEGGLLDIQNIGNVNDGVGLDNSTGEFQVASDGILRITSVLQSVGAIGDLSIEEGGRVVGMDFVDVNLIGPGPLVIEAAENFDPGLGGQTISQFAGTINNPGVITFSSNPNTNSDAIMEIEGPTSFTGGGEIVMVDEDSRIQNGSGNLPDDELINVDNTIRGQGRIFGTITNQSVIRAEGGLLDIQNLGNVRDGFGLDNSAGEFQVASDGILRITNVLQSGGAIGDLSIEEGGRVLGMDFVDVNLIGPGPLVIEAAENFDPALQGETISEFAGTINNPGVITFSSNPNTSSQAILEIEGPTSFTGGGEIVLVDQDSWIVNGSGNLPDDELINVDNTIRGQGRISATITNRSVIRAEGGLLTVSSDLAQTSTGRLEADAGATLEIQFTNQNNPFVLTDGAIGGTGTIKGFIANTGATVDPGASPGTLTIDGGYTHEAGATLLIEIGGVAPGEFDVLNVLGDVDLLGGTLELVFTNDDFFIPTGTTFDALVATEISGSFNEILLPTDDSGTPLFAADFSQTGLLKLVAQTDIEVLADILLGDYNGNGEVDAADYTIWADNFGSTTDLAADGNGDGVVDAADYTIWADNFGTGNASAVSLSNIPEPATGLVLLGMSLVVGRRRNRCS
ncbi:MAG: dockerin type I domain-containing protein [Planctomycetota bacterium]